MVPSFMRVTGVVQEPSDSSVDPVLVGDGTVVRAIIGGTLCGQVETMTLHGEFRSMNLFGLKVLPDELKEGCGQEGSLVSFCINGFSAEVPNRFGRYSSGSETVTWTANEPEFGGEPPAARLVLEPTAKLCPVVLAQVLPPTGSGQPSNAESIPHVLLIAIGGGLTAIGASLLMAFSRGGQTRKHPS